MQVRELTHTTFKTLVFFSREACVFCVWENRRWLRYMMWFSRKWRILRKTGKFLLIFALVSGWLFSGFPQIWDNPRIPPGPRTAEAATTVIVLNFTQTILTAGTTTATWTVPSDWDNGSNTIEVIGGGGSGWADNTGAGGAGGGGGGAYAKATNITLTPGAAIDYQIGWGGATTSIGAFQVGAMNGGDTWFRAGVVGSSTCST
ncbi:MAG: hypothetical protein HYY60_00355 [Parcubacteria group bacterium]|nr:hypothetical protein [Parcubacteria group bacterium]